MKRVGLLIIALALLLSVPGRVRGAMACPPMDPDTGATPPCCQRVDKYVNMPERAAQVEAELMADRQHEYVVILDCLTGHVIVHAVGPQFEVNYKVYLAQVTNELMIHSHPLGTMPSIEDMQWLHDLNPLEFRLIGFDLMSQSWSRCTFKKDFRETWPVINEVEFRQLKAMEYRLFQLETGMEFVRWDNARRAMWSAWAVSHGIPMLCEAIGL